MRPLEKVQASRIRSVHRTSISPSQNCFSLALKERFSEPLQVDMSEWEGTSWTTVELEGFSKIVIVRVVNAMIIPFLSGKLEVYIMV